MPHLNLVHTVHVTLALTPLHLVEILVLKHIVAHIVSLLLLLFLLLLLELLLPTHILVLVGHQVVGVGTAEFHHGLVGVVH